MKKKKAARTYVIVGAGYDLRCGYATEVQLAACAKTGVITLDEGRVIHSYQLDGNVGGPDTLAAVGPRSCAETRIGMACRLMQREVVSVYYCTDAARDRILAAAQANPA